MDDKTKIARFIVNARPENLEYEDTQVFWRNLKKDFPNQTLAHRLVDNYFWLKPKIWLMDDSDLDGIERLTKALVACTP